MNQIDLFVIYAELGKEYVDFNRKFLETFKSDSSNINYYCIHSGEVSTTAKGFTCLGKTPKWKKNPEHGSANHALGLNMVPQFIKSEYTIIIDSDIAIVYKDWDKIMIEKLQDHACFGFSFGDKGPRYRNFPGVFFFGFRSDIINKVDLDWSPKTKPDGTSLHKYTLKDPEEAAIHGARVGETLKCDTGWKIPIIMKNAGYTGFALKRVLSGEKNCLLPYKTEKQKKFCLQKPEHMAEWHYNNELFGSHKQASRIHHLTDSDWGRTWHERLNLYTQKKYKITL